MTTTHETNIRRDGALTVAALAELTQQLAAVAPPDARVLIRTESDPRDHDEWTRAIVRWED